MNMTSRELQEWLMTRESGPAAEEFPDQSVPRARSNVLAILRYAVPSYPRRRGSHAHVSPVTSERGVDLEPTPGWPTGATS